MPLGPEHAFASGAAYPRPSKDVRRWPWQAATPAHRAALAWAQFETAAQLDPGILLGPSAWCINARNDRALLRLGPRVICRGVLRVETFGRGSITVGAGTYLGDDSLLSASAGIQIGADVLIAHGVQIFDNDSHPLDAAQRLADFAAIRAGQERPTAAIAGAPIRIGDRVWIGFHAIVLKGVTIGEESVIAAGSVVTHDVPPRSVAAGNPARILRTL